MGTKELEVRIEALRGEMVHVGMSRGLTDPETVRISQELDGLLNELSRQNRKG